MYKHHIRALTRKKTAFRDNICPRKMPHESYNVHLELQPGAFHRASKEEMVIAHPVRIQVVRLLIVDAGRIQYPSVAPSGHILRDF